MKRYFVNRVFRKLFYHPQVRRVGVSVLLAFFCKIIFIPSIAVCQPQHTAVVENGHEIRIACVGNSITHGAGLKDKANESYPAVLQKKLGDGYEVGNFGKNGATLLYEPPNAYTKTEEYKNAIAFKPDIVIIDLGINDTGLKVWPFYHESFTADYLRLIETFRSLESKPVIWICTMTPYFNQSKRFTSALRDWYWEIQENIQLVAETARTGLIDLHDPLYSRPQLFSDAVHPDKDGARIMAETIYGAISGDYGGLSVAEVFGSHMVLQRNKPIPVWGKANYNQEVQVTFAGKTLRAKGDVNGNWKVTFPSRKEGGPFEIAITSGKEKLTFEDVLVGEVWICSGQSNMTFKLSEAATAATDLPLATYSDIRLFNMRTADKSIQTVWEPDVLDRINNLEYEGNGWERCTPESAAGFSAVAYYFGKELHDELKVPIGLVHNSKGGSPAEAWVDRKTMEFDAVLADLFQDWKKNPLITQWCRDRAVTNTSKAENPLQRHPYEPSYLFEACMKPWIGFPLKGAIWYQGEANVHNVALHETLFKALIKSWRQYWGDDFPVYFTQLSSYHSPGWPAFRDSQRRLVEEIPRTGMAVTTDIGDSLDIHPKRKKQVGERLARWALAKEYGMNLEYSGPLFLAAHAQKNRVVITFTHGKGLAASDGKALRSFELAGKDKVFMPGIAIVEGRTVTVQSDKVRDPWYVRYGWKPYSDGNLINSDDLPASTFAATLPRK